MVEFTPNPEYYDDGSTPDDMLAIEIENALDDPFLFIEGPNAVFTVVGSLVDD